MTDQDGTIVKPNLGSFLTSHLYIPLFFLGIGVYRAWIEIMYTNPPQVLAGTNIIGDNVSDIVHAICLLVIALLARRIAPLYEKKKLVWISCIAMVLATVLNFASGLYPDIAGGLTWLITLLASWGLAVVALLWCEFFGCLNSFRVILYFSASLIFGWVIMYFLQGLAFGQLLIATALLPLISVACAMRSFGTLSQDDQPKVSGQKCRFPWKLVLIMATYTFAFALFQGNPSQFGGPLSSIGMLIVAIVVFIIGSFFTEQFSVESLFRFSLPIMALGLFLASFVTQGVEGFSGIFISASYALFAIMLMVVMSNLSYRYGVIAVWLFGIERAVRYVAYAIGGNTESFLATNFVFEMPLQTLLGFAAIVLIVASTTFLFMGKGLFADWGVTIEKSDALGKAVSVTRNESIERHYNLTPREAEVYRLLAQGKNSAVIERELFIANGTAKSHIQRIYKKLGVHSKRGFLDKVNEYGSGGGVSRDEGVPDKDLHGDGA